MQPAHVGPRVLLRRLREVMAGPEAAQTRLNKITTLIASNMVAEVCSIYVMRPGGFLELYATEGLNADALHETKLRVGEGLVGVIAANASPLNLPEAQAHPAFKYLPETGEEVYHSFLGVPVLRSGLILGVLTVQNRTQRHYSEEEVEAMQTTAMVLAEVVASGELDEVGEAEEVDLGHTRSHQLSGASFSGGVALGHVVLHRPRIHITNLIAEDVRAEKERLSAGVERLRESVDTMITAPDLARSGEHREVLEAYRMFAHDRGWVRRLQEAVDTGLTAEAAVEREQSNTRARMMRSRDPYLQERLHDLDDLANRLLRILTGTTGTAAGGELPKDAIVVARSMGAAELLDYDRDRVRGVVLQEGGGNSHATIVARALGIPLVGQVQGILNLSDTGDSIIVDGDSGEIFLRPLQSIREAYGEKVSLYAKRQAQYTRLRGEAAQTRDGTPINLNINAGLLMDLPHLERAGAEGIGLFRTELQFMIASSFPRMDEQVSYYRAVLDSAGDKPVVFRTLDIGADKTLPYLHHGQEENPALGWRAIRMSLDRPALLKLQLRAFLKAAGGRKLSVMFPMVAEADEFRKARALVDEEFAFLTRHGHEAPTELRVGAMIEVPALVWQLPALLPLTDFVSVGTNDLLQFLFAYDRGNPQLAAQYDALSPAFLSLMKQIVEQSEKHKVPLTVCGEIAGMPLEALALMALGVRSVSMVPAAIGPVKTMLRSVDLAAAREVILPLLDHPDHSLRDEILRFASKSGVQLHG
ncbi:MAG: phosphoenolpyruvate--protein phosphotransferase [Alphaproteobacteria bacterium]|nr:phosphoenolpyruvate--protein phosphotransferase [Alphaproteobacteria bacterium]